MLKGYSVPRSPLGEAALVPAPPWHYAGDLLVIEYWAAPEAAAAVLPPGLKPYADDPGRCAAVFVDWQSCTSGQTELLDPVRSQYKEFFIVVNALYQSEAVTYCPYIWVDKDFALARGWIQGFPKKLGSIHITRPFSVASQAAPGIGPGGRFAGTLSANDRRLASGVVTLQKPSSTGPTHNDPPITNVRYFPRLANGQQHNPAVHELVRARSRDRAVSEIWEGTAELELMPAPHEEHAALSPVRMGKGFRFSFAYTVDDLETLFEFPLGNQAY